MINYLKGTLVTKTENSPSGCNITVEVNNIGYLVNTNSRVITSLPPEGNEVIIYTSLIHREDQMSLCGFDSREDRDLFNLLQSVSGIGTKAALMMLGELGAYELISAVIRGDDKAISRTKGVGPKLAQRVILELKDKMMSWRDKFAHQSPEVQKIESPATKESYLETESVLLSLGYSKDEATKSLEMALDLAENKNDPEELLRFALKWLASQ